MNYKNIVYLVLIALISSCSTQGKVEDDYSVYERKVLEKLVLQEMLKEAKFSHFLELKVDPDQFRNHIIEKEVQAESKVELGKYLSKELDNVEYIKYGFVSSPRLLYGLRFDFVVNKLDVIVFSSRTNFYLDGKYIGRYKIDSKKLTSYLTKREY